MRAVLSAALLLGCIGLCSTAAADAAPSPERPEWSETPLPMPEPLEVALVLGACLFGGGAVMLARRQRALA